MKKKVRIIAMLIIVCMMFGCSQNQSDVERECYKKVTAITCDEKGKELFRYTELYDDNDQMIQYIQGDLEVNYKVENGLCLEMSDGEDRIEYKYNEKNELVESVCYKDEVLSSRTQYEYDEHGNRMYGKTEIYQKGKYVLDSEQFLNYNENNQLLEVTHKNADGSKQVFVHEYQNGELVKSVDYNGRISEYMYNEKNQLIQKNSVDKNGEKMFTKYEYDDQGRKVKEILAIDEEDLINNIVTYSYEEQCEK